MVPYLGDFAEDASVLMPFNTFTSDNPSASATITNLADADVKVHKDGNATPLVTDGATVAIDFASITGNHLVTVDTSAHADYSTGSDYHVRIEGTTVDGATVNAWVGHFSIENRTTFPKADYPANFAAMGIESDGDLTKVNTLNGHTAQTGDTYALANGATGFAAIDTVVDGIQTDLSNGTDGLGAIKADTAAILTDTADMQPKLGTPAADVSADIAAVKADSAAILTDTADIQPKIGTPAADLSADIAAVKVDTAAVLVDTGTTLDGKINTIDGIVDAILLDTAEIGAAGAGLTDLGGMSTAMKAEVNAEADTAISDAALATAANLATVDGIVDTLNLGIITGAAATGTLSTTQATTDLTGYADDQLVGRHITWTSGDCEGEQTAITDYASASGLLTFTALTTAPGNGDTFKVT